MNLAVIFELAGLIEFDRGRRLTGFDLSRVEGFAIVIGGGCVLCQRGVGPCDGIADMDLNRLWLVAQTLHRYGDRLGFRCSGVSEAGQQCEQHPSSRNGDSVETLQCDLLLKTRAQVESYRSLS